jgi:uncharacterized protein (DUF433 family)
MSHEKTKMLVRPNNMPKAVIISDDRIMSGMPVVKGTRIPAETIIAYLKAGYTNRDIFEDYPTLPLDGIDAVIAWANERYGPDWRGSAKHT